MSEFLTAALSFPAVLFSFALAVVLLYWLLVLLGGAELELLDAGDAGTDGGLLNVVGLGGVPVTVALSVLITVSWFVSLVGVLLLDGAGIGGFPGALVAAGLLVVAVLVGLLATRLVVLPLRRVFREEPQQSRGDFVGRTCVIRTGRVGPDFGQAEVTSDDGSSAVIQVRQDAEQPADLRSGSNALIYDYDPVAEVFWVGPHTE